MAQFPRFTSAVELRRSPRLTFALPVKIRGLDASGVPFTERTHTVDVNERGGRLQTHNLLRPRDRLYIENPMLKQAAMATIAWVGRKKSPFEPYEVGIALDTPQNLWGIEFPNAPASLTSPGGRSSQAGAGVPPGTAMAAPGSESADVPPGAGPASSEGGRNSPKPAKPINPAALRRSTRLTISLPITISGLDAQGNPFSEQTRTVGVNKHGGKLLTRFELKLRDPVYLENLKIKVNAKATVAWIGERKNPNDPWEVGVALDEPMNIWGIDFPPDDWSDATPIRKEKTAEAASSPVMELRPTPPATPGPEGASPSDTQVGVAPPVLVPIAPPQTAPTAKSAPAAKSSPAPVIASPPVDASAAAAQLSEQMKLLAEAHSRLFQREFADLASGLREKLQQEMQGMIDTAVGDATAKARQQMQHDLEQFASQLTEMEKQITGASLDGLRKRLAAMLASLDAPPSGKS